MCVTLNIGSVEANKENTSTSISNLDECLFKIKESNFSRDCFTFKEVMDFLEPNAPKWQILAVKIYNVNSKIEKRNNKISIDVNTSYSYRYRRIFSNIFISLCIFCSFL